VIAFLLAAAMAFPVPALPPPLDLTPAEVLSRYADALPDARAPLVVTFEYALEQTGMRNGEQNHRVFRSGDNERDELLAVDGRKLMPPTVRVFRGRRNRYTVADIAPRSADYAFKYVGKHSVGKRTDYVFETTPRGRPAFRVTQVTIDGNSFVPTTVAFAAERGGGAITFVRVDRYWVPSVATAHASYRNVAATERIVFSRYRFPAALPASTFVTAPAGAVDRAAER
jgi:hypothetical protein